MPYGAGNTHPRFFGWVHGSGTAQNLLADITAAAINANAGGRDHGAIHVERQVIRWCRELFGFPDTASGLVVSGTSLATAAALKVSRNVSLGFATRKVGLAGSRLTGYASAEVHACNPRAFDILGLGAHALGKIPVNDRFEMDTAAPRAAIYEDRAAGFEPFVIIGTAGTVDAGALIRSWSLQISLPPKISGSISTRVRRARLAPAGTCPTLRRHCARRFAGL